jgi:glycine/D-amino acid oxidase-like deaminating enzyme
LDLALPHGRYVNVPSRSRYVVVGAGIHGLSTAYHLAKELRTRGLGSGADVLVLDKRSPGSGASGIACGVVRNNYFQPAMSELMQACVEVWESDPAAYHYNPVGYIALGAAVQESDLIATYERQERIGYRSELIVGAADVDAHMKELFPDWRARGVTVCLHEHQGGFAFNMASVIGLVGKCESEGVTILSEVEVQDLELGPGDAVTGVLTSAGRIEVGEQLVLAPGPWAKHFWGMLGRPMTIDIRTPSGDVVEDRPMWTYWNLQEGEIKVDPAMFATADGGPPAVIHLDSDAPLYTDDGQLVTDELWGIYFKRDRDGVQGGGSPLVVDGDIELDPYPQTTNVDPNFPDMWCAALSHAMSRFEGCRALYATARSGGVGAITADNFPVFDYLKPNV